MHSLWSTIKTGMPTYLGVLIHKSTHNRTQGVLYLWGCMDVPMSSALLKLIHLCKQEHLWSLSKWSEIYRGTYRAVPEKAMAPHSSTLAWKMPWMEEPGRLQSVGSLRVGHHWATSLSLFTFMHWRRKWQPTPVFLPGESQEWGNMVGCRLWGHTESDTTEVT